MGRNAAPGCLVVGGVRRDNVIRHWPFRLSRFASLTSWHAPQAAPPGILHSCTEESKPPTLLSFGDGWTNAVILEVAHCKPSELAGSYPTVKISFRKHTRSHFESICKPAELAGPYPTVSPIMLSIDAVDFNDVATARTVEPHSLSITLNVNSMTEGETLYRLSCEPSSVQSFHFPPPRGRHAASEHSALWVAA